MNSRDEQLWRYIDGTASEEERTALEQQLPLDVELLKEWELRRKLDEHLVQMELEQPSLRFVQNLMEQLPKLYQRIPIKPLIDKIWTRVYLGGYLLLVIGLLAFGFDRLASSYSLISLNGFSSILNIEVVAAFPFRLTIILISFTSAILYLMWLDKRLSRRLQKKE